MPLQSLSLMNAGFVAARARKLAERVERDCKDIAGEANADARITRAFLLATGRAPDQYERSAARRFLETHPSRYPGRSEPDARQQRVD